MVVWNWYEVYTTKHYINYMFWSEGKKWQILINIVQFSMEVLVFNQLKAISIWPKGLPSLKDKVWQFIGWIRQKPFQIEMKAINKNRRYLEKLKWKTRQNILFCIKDQCVKRPPILLLTLIWPLLGFWTALKNLFVHL